MKIISEIALKDFEFWSGAKEWASVFTEEQLDALDSELQQQYPEGIDDGDLNNLFWFEPDFLAQMIGFKDIEELEEYNKSIISTIVDEEYNKKEIENG